MEFEDFVTSLKPFTKIYMGASILCGLVMTLKILDPYYLVLIVPDTLWNPLRYITSIFFMQSIGMNTIMDLLFFYFTNNALESSYFPNRYGDYLYMLIFIIIGNYVF